MPELPEVETVRRRLAAVMTGVRLKDVLLGRPDLRGPFPENFAARLERRRVRDVSRRGKYLLLSMSSGDTLLMHLGMSGWFRVVTANRTAARLPVGLHDHVVFRLSSGVAVIFNDPRRFGFMDLLSPAQLAGYPALKMMGPEPLLPEFDAHALARACAGKAAPLKVVLLDQRIVAGVGNIYASEALHRAHLSPLRRASTIATASGAPRESAVALVAAIKAVLIAAIERLADESHRSSGFRVYGREDARCPTRGCGGTIRRLIQAGRSTFYCPRCQR